MTKLIVTFRNFAKVPKKSRAYFSSKCVGEGKYLQGNRRRDYCGALNCLGDRRKPLRLNTLSGLSATNALIVLNLSGFSDYAKLDQELN